MTSYPFIPTLIWTREELNGANDGANTFYNTHTPLPSIEVVRTIGVSASNVAKKGGTLRGVAPYNFPCDGELALRVVGRTHA